MAGVTDVPLKEFVTPLRRERPRSPLVTVEKTLDGTDVFIKYGDIPNLDQHHTEEFEALDVDPYETPRGSRPFSGDGIPF